MSRKQPIIFKQRLLPLDAMRGVVIVLMALDHASHAFNAGRYVTDSAAFYQPGAAIPTLQFFIRWITHICAPAFLFLSGWALCIAITKRRARGESNHKIDLYILTRGILLLLLEPFWMSLAFGYGIVFQVLYAIGGSLCCMILLRRLGTGPLLGISLGLLILGEVLAGLAFWAGGVQQAGPLGALTVTGGRVGQSIFVLYPLLPWLAYMILGWCVGRWVLDGSITSIARVFLQAGIGSILTFVILRGFNGYGNMLLYREGWSLIQWLHVSKYPPSLTFSALELGLMFLCLAGLWLWFKQKTLSNPNPLIVFGQTPLFFYIFHVHLLSGTAKIFGIYQKSSLAASLAATFGVLLVLYPFCFWYRRIRQTQAYRILKYF
ncbi:MAG: heparan-alpha-glucosaminide N-acetyltransferase domain-containing protein [Desulfobacterales bacterium]|jgi:uncharacterized membrane protein